MTATNLYTLLHSIKADPVKRADVEFQIDVLTPYFNDQERMCRFLFDSFVDLELHGNLRALLVLMPDLLQMPLVKKLVQDWASKYPDDSWWANKLNHYSQVIQIKPYVYADIDVEMIPIIRILNYKGYITSNCCRGDMLHNTEPILDYMLHKAENSKWEGACTYITFTSKLSKDAVELLPSDFDYMEFDGEQLSYSMASEIVITDLQVQVEKGTSVYGDLLNWAREIPAMADKEGE